MLQEYYRLKFNPNIKMEGKILDRLGFKPCRHCYDYTSMDELFGTENPSKMNNKNIDRKEDDLPF